MSFAIIRTNDGTFKDPVYRSHMQDAESAGLVTAAYTYLRNPNEGSTIKQQVDTMLAVMGDMKRPVWLDCENNAGLSAGHIREFKRLSEAAGVRVIGCYSYVPWWEGKVIGGEPDSHEFGKFWVAAYNNNPSGAPSAIYPGDHNRQWSYPLGNQMPSLWQFGSRGLVCGREVDVNAYRGSVSDLKKLFYGSTSSDSHDNVDDMSDIRVQSLINPKKSFKPVDAVSIIDATGWENRQLLLAICAKLGLDANKILRDAKEADNAK